MKPIHTSQLSEFVKAVGARNGNLNHPEIVSTFYPLDLSFDYIVDEDIDPFSEEYVDQQIALYREISGRELNQESGELHNIDISHLIDQPNPTGIPDADRVNEHVRCVSTIQALSCLRGRPRILDMGAGQGLGSEIIGYTGCSVHAVDIDQHLSVLARRRAAQMKISLTRSDMNFDDIGLLEGGAYDAAFFFQSLHHCIRPWELIGNLKRKLRPGGIIGFVGEPVQSLFWKHWGIRLDHESVYVARAWGWFESGWSHDFIRSCFARNGLELMFFTGGYLGGEIGIATDDAAKRDEIRSRARELGLRETQRRFGLEITDDQYLSHTGEPSNLAGRPAFRQVEKRNGALIYGPYATLEAGDYEVAFIVSYDCGKSVWDRVTFIVELASTSGMILRKEITSKYFEKLAVIRLNFSLTEINYKFECRLYARDVGVTATVPYIKRLGTEN
jgi:2-polyprenyl-3-methyl-5-hydroxy-6-metoxy-1,4-benzoquinol methylase